MTEVFQKQMKKNEKRSLTREIAMQYLFLMEMQDNFQDFQGAIKPEEMFSLREETPVPLDEEYLDLIIETVVSNRSEIDGIISQKATNWKISRISKVDLSILRLSTAEILFMEEIPRSASINEAVELAKKYGSHDSSKFINGILGRIASEGQHGN